MVDKETAIDILEDVKATLLEANNADKALKTIDIYIKNLRIAINPKIKQLIEQQSKYREEFGEDDKRTIKLNKKIDKEMNKIYNGKGN